METPEFMNINNTGFLESNYEQYMLSLYALELMETPEFMNINNIGFLESNYGQCRV